MHKRHQKDRAKLLFYLPEGLRITFSMLTQSIESMHLKLALSGNILRIVIVPVPKLQSCLFWEMKKTRQALNSMWLRCIQIRFEDHNEAM